METVGRLAKPRLIGRVRTDFAFAFAVGAYNLIRIPKPIATEANP